MPLPHAILILACVLALASPGAHAADAKKGQGLYNSICVSCHGNPPVGGPETAANQPGVIRNAINTIGPMQFLRNFFTNADLEDIAAYLASLGSVVTPPGPTGPPVPAFNYTDLWWNPTESGWGFNIIQHESHVIFAVIYTYTAPNRPMWYVLPGGEWTSSTTFTGKLYRVTGSPGNVPFKAGQVVEVGSATLLFTDSSHASLTYSVDGVLVTKSIERQPF